jgi:hypothetical protein
MLTIPNRVFLSVLAGALVFWLMASLIPLDPLIVILNGVYAGCMAAVAVAYWKLLVNAVLGVRPYDRVRQMTISFVLCWIALSGSVFISIYFRSAGMPPSNATLMTAAFRVVAIVAAVLQVTAPDFGLGIFHGRERKTLWTGLLVGLIVALFVAYAQQEAVIESFVNTSDLFDVASLEPTA